MIRLVIEIDLGNAAFEDDREVGRIAREVVSRAFGAVHGFGGRSVWLRGGEGGTVRDVNGNRVCAWSVEEVKP